jgi:hypothetical protein
MRWSGLSVVALAITCLGTPADGHHSYGDIYLESDMIEIEGTIVEFQYVNPHSWIHVAARDAFGRETVYAGEWVSTSQLERQGITKTTLRAGDTVRMWASPARRPNDARIHVKRLRRSSDGFEWRGGQGANQAR